VRGGLRIVAGRPVQPGLEEVMVGRRIQERIRGLQLGDTVKYRRFRLKVVGVFESEGGAFESELWGDYDTLGGRQGPGSASVVLRVADPAQIAELDRWMARQPDMPLRAVAERRYYEEQAGPVVRVVRGLGGLVAIVTGIGGVFAAMNTMYRIVASRTREVGTLRAIGFSRRAILLAFVAESALVGLVGGVLGCLLASMLHGFSTSTANLQSFSEVAFAFRMTPAIVGRCLAFALAVGFLGGLLPALRAARLPIVTALRES
jgi:ABC-type lipoprotein release transport system permease subunit